MTFPGIRHALLITLFWLESPKINEAATYSVTTNHIEITNKMQTCTGIYYSSVLLIVQHVSSDTPLIIRSSKTVIAASGFTVPTQPRQLPATTNVCKTRGCNYSFWAPNDERCVLSKHVEQLRIIGTINYTTRSYLVGYFYTIFLEKGISLSA